MPIGVSTPMSRSLIARVFLPLRSCSCWTGITCQHQARIQTGTCRCQSHTSLLGMKPYPASSTRVSVRVSHVMSCHSHAMPGSGTQDDGAVCVPRATLTLVGCSKLLDEGAKEPGRPRSTLGASLALAGGAAAALGAATHSSGRFVRRVVRVVSRPVVVGGGLVVLGDL